LNVGPLYELRLTTPRVEVRLGTREELAALGRLAQEGIHPPREMPFAVAWTDRSTEEKFVEDFVEFHEAALRAWTPEKWSLNLLVFVGGQPAGSQTIEAEDFVSTRTVATGSWLGKRFQRQGLGTEMRASVLELAFRALGAEKAASGAVAGNEASKRVSEKLGYTIVGTSTVSPRGEPLTQHDLRIERDAWRAPLHVEIEGLARCLPLFGLSEAS
jgi:RimJ/RimL family protein N-acetyltransferase